MNRHWHMNVDELFMIFLAILVLNNVARLSTAWLAKKQGPAGSIGTAFGALFS